MNNDHLLLLLFIAIVCLSRSRLELGSARDRGRNHDFPSQNVTSTASTSDSLAIARRGPLRAVKFRMYAELLEPASGEDHMKNIDECGGCSYKV